MVLCAGFEICNLVANIECRLPYTRTTVLKNSTLENRVRKHPRRLAGTIGAACHPIAVQADVEAAGAGVRQLASTLVNLKEVVRRDILLYLQIPHCLLPRRNPQPGGKVRASLSWQRSGEPAVGPAGAGAAIADAVARVAVAVNWVADASVAAAA